MSCYPRCSPLCFQFPTIYNNINTKSFSKLFTFAFRQFQKEFFRTWYGIKRDATYTYYADGTKEKSSESSIVWDEKYRSEKQCSTTNDAGPQVHAESCSIETLALCERSACLN